MQCDQECALLRILLQGKCDSNGYELSGKTDLSDLPCGTNSQVCHGCVSFRAGQTVAHVYVYSYIYIYIYIYVDVHITLYIKRETETEREGSYYVYIYIHMYIHQAI